MPDNTLFFEFLDRIEDPNLRQLVQDIIESSHQFDNHIEFQKEMNTADTALDILFTMLEDKQIFDRNIRPYKSWIDILIAAVYLYYAVHNRLDPESFVELFSVRQNWWHTAERYGISASAFDVLCQAVEAGKGTSGVPACKPVPGTPTELMSIAILIADKIIPKYAGQSN